MIDWARNCTRMNDRHGKPIHMNSLLKYITYDSNQNIGGFIYCIGRPINVITYPGYIRFTFLDGVCRDPNELEVLTEDEAVLAVFEGAKLKV